MGILNVTPDSFSDGGKHVDTAAAADAGFAMGTAGAAIIDVGGESTRPGAPLIWEGDEVARIEGVVAALSKGGVAVRSEEHTSELQSLMRISYAVLCLKKKKLMRQEAETSRINETNQ